MKTKWCLLKESDGARGANGKKKVYEITIEGTVVRTSWGMAEKRTRQRGARWFSSETAAHQFAMNKRYEKLAKGYELAYAV